MISTFIEKIKYFVRYQIFKIKYKRILQKNKGHITYKDDNAYYAKCEYFKFE